MSKRKVNKNLEVIELCAGIGQTSLGLKQACDKLGINMKINAFCEIDEQASKAYLALHEGNIPNLRDITKASFKGMRCDVLLATTPCTNISRIGNRKGFKEGSGRLIIGKEVLTLKMNYGKGYVEVGILDETREKVPLVFNFDIDLMKEHGHKGHRPFVYLLKFRDNDFEYLEEIAIRMMFTIMRLKKNEIF